MTPERLADIQGQIESSDMIAFLTVAQGKKEAVSTANWFRKLGYFVKQDGNEGDNYLVKIYKKKPYNF